MTKTSHLLARALVVPAAAGVIGLGFGLAPATAAPAAPAAVAAPASPAQTCNPIPAPPAGFHWAGGCFVGPAGSPASAQCAQAGQDGINRHAWSDWRCIGELRGGGDFYYFLYVR